MKPRMFWGWGLSLVALGTVQVDAAVTLWCVPEPAHIGAEASVTVKCFIESSEAINIRATQIDLPCELPGGEGASGTVIIQDAQVDREHIDPPFLFGPGSLLSTASVQRCLATGTPAVGVPSVSLPANQPRYLATFIYAVDACGGEFELAFERFTIPPRANDQTRLLGPGGSADLIAFTAETATITVDAPDGTPCDDGLFCTARDECLDGACGGVGSPCPGQACDEETDACVPLSCPEPLKLAVQPQPGLVDARQPYPIDDSAMAEGIGSSAEPLSVILGVLNVPEDCFFICESAVDPQLGENAVSAVEPMGPGSYQVKLAHAIAPGAATTVVYGATTLGHYYFHPGNVNGDAVAGTADVTALVSILNGQAIPMHGLYSADLNRSGAVTPEDLMRVTDLLNGAGPYAVWRGTPRPVEIACP